MGFISRVRRKADPGERPAGLPASRKGSGAAGAGPKGSGGGAAGAATAKPGRATMGRRVVVFVVAAAALAVLIGAATGDRGYLEVLRRRSAYDQLSDEVATLRAQNAALAGEIRALKTDPYVIEKLAREKLGYARPGEVIYLFPPVEAPAP